jgi:hypothetical protein
MAAAISAADRVLAQSSIFAIVYEKPCACVRATFLRLRSRAVIGVASGDTGISAARRYVIFIVSFFDRGIALPDRRSSCVGVAQVRLKLRPKPESGYSRGV